MITCVTNFPRFRPQRFTRGTFKNIFEIRFFNSKCHNESPKEVIKKCCHLSQVVTCVVQNEHKTCHESWCGSSKSYTCQISKAWFSQYSRSKPAVSFYFMCSLINRYVNLSSFHEFFDTIVSNSIVNSFGNTYL